MPPPRLQQIEDLFHRALERNPEERRAFVIGACGDNEVLRLEVLSLLEADMQTQVLDTPAADLAAGLADLWPPEPATQKVTRKHPFWWFAALAALFLAAYLVFSVAMLVRYGAETKDDGWTSSTRKGQLVVLSVDPNGPAAGKLRPGDRVLDVNSDPRGSRLGKTLLRDARPGTDYTLRVRRGALELSVQLASGQKRSERTFAFAISLLLVGAVFAAAGVLVGLAQPGQESARYFCLMAVPMSIVWMHEAIGSTFSLMNHAEFLVVTLVGWAYPFQYVYGYWFCYRFPPGVPRGRFWSFAAWAITVTCLCHWFFERWHEFATLGAPWAIDTLYRYIGLSRSWSSFFGQFNIVYFIACAAVLFRNFRRVGDSDQRRRLRWVTVGMAAGFIPLPLPNLILAPLAKMIGHALPAHVQFQLWWWSLVMIVFMPLSAGYGILKHRVFDINVVIRRGVRYLLTKNGMRLILAVLVAMIGYSIVAQSNRSLRDIVFYSPTSFYVLVAVSVAFGVVYRYRLMDWVDRRFFRETYSQEKILISLNAAIGTLTSLEELSSRVSEEISNALHPEKMWFFFRNPVHGDFALVYPQEETLRRWIIPARSWVVSVMESSSATRDILSLRDSNFPVDEQYLYSRLGVELLVPMRGSNGRLVGLLLLGAKRSEEPYNDSDRRLLEAMGFPMAFVCENIWLKEDVFKGKRIQHEVLSRLEDQQIQVLKECPACGACYDSTADLCKEDGATLVLTLPIARTIEGKYRLDRLLGRGGMGAVYAGEDLQMRRKIAVKVMLGSMFGNPIALQRFAREAQAAARLTHPNIVTVYDYGELHGQGGAGAYLVMEQVKGVSLRQELQNGGATREGVPSWFFQLLAAVHAAHQNGVIHRDLKPENILLSRSDAGTPVVKVLDFGLAKIASERPDFTLTAAGVPLGTLGYMSPEQLRGEPIDHRSDIFSLGVILAECLTGQRPFHGRSITDLLRSMGEPVSVPGPKHLTAAIQRSLAHQPSDRFASVAEFESALR
ncbi:MAG TPA: protein kinase [Bryobacteraceae bacterium]|nr:protein kinase [Bryobacteraceae bacterium]